MLVNGLRVCFSQWHERVAAAQVISMATDKVIKTWDLRMQRCLQTITPHDWPEAQDARPSAICFDQQDSRLLTAAQRPVSWRQLSAASALAGHSARICAALYNATFDVVRPLLHKRPCPAY